MGREIRLREKRLKKNRQIVSCLPREMGGHIVSPGLTGIPSRPFVLLAVSGILILMGAGGYFIRAWHSEPGTPTSNEIVTSSSPPFSPRNPGPVVEGTEVEKIRVLFETVRQANLQKNIDLFMGCFSRDFTSKEKKRLETLEMWNHFNYLTLSYDLEKTMISGDTADVRLEWLVKVSQKNGGKHQENKVVLDARLKKEDGRWKIKEIKTES